MKLSVFNGSLPKIGIRPTIDGRLGGVRESLEKQTLDMARAAAKLISQNLFYPNGKNVECVIADTCIGGVAEALIATMCGLGIAVTCLFPYNYLNARTEQAKQEIADASHALEILIKKTEVSSH